MLHCNSDHKKFILPIVHHKAKEFLSCKILGDNYRNNELTFDNMNKVPNILWGSPDWKKHIFGKETVCQYNVFSFLFQLLATGILSIDYEGSNGVRFLLTGEDDGNFCTKVPVWKGFEFRTSSKGNNSVTFADLMSVSKDTSNAGRSARVRTDDTSDYIQYFNHGAKITKVLQLLQIKDVSDLDYE